ncbi:conserved hypothetical protein [Rippkaea orientalis PCC 8801]|uniref:LRAT domain-containing protein n=1 Tax=Rippkaea orientalis (strain PCC 8801 / RF-1) TaxID=41431 RepID=B7K323_RIPO1|nr:lecithin retinol acyltransferase family protein [Rippkaea orientalis]ACK67724.1 conserved hypothetical protein [Rippkaea orientalis PCC 8801]
MARGDQIYVYRELLNLNGVYEHHGIDCGDGYVIHYRKPSETIEKTTLLTFTRGNSIYLREYPNEFCFIPDVVVSRAHVRLGEQKYNFLFNNCEHFATWCKTGINHSTQIKEFLPFLKHLNVAGLYNPLKQALKESDPQNAQRLLQEALDDIRVVWDDLQPQYKQAIKERDTWDQVAREAVKRNRDDLARAALEKKLTYQQKINRFKEQLDQLAIMTEKVLKNLLI